MCPAARASKIIKRFAQCSRVTAVANRCYAVGPGQRLDGRRHQLAQLRGLQCLGPGAQAQQVADGVRGRLDRNHRADPAAGVRRPRGLADGPVPFHFPAPDYFDELLSRKEAP